MIMNNQNMNNTNELRVPIQNGSAYQIEAVKVEEEKIQPLSIGYFPLNLQEIINTCAETYRTPRDYWAGAVLAATSLAIGNKLELVTIYRNVPLLWLVLLGDVSSGKSNPLDFCLEYFKKLDACSIKKYNEDLAEFNRLSSMSNRERMDEGIIDKLVRPECMQFILNDFTPEAMVEAHKANSRGMMILRDELKGLFDDFGRYNKSGEQSNMLSAWSGIGMSYNRKTSGVMNIEHPCINVCGGMQPDLLRTLAADYRAENGFLSRMCMVFPDNTLKAEYSTKMLPDKIRLYWEEYLSDLVNQNSKLELTLSSEAEDKYEKWYNMNCDQVNKESSGYLKGVYGKLDIICLRLAVILKGMNMACEGEYSKQISAREMEGAIGLTEYFRAAALKVYGKLFGPDGSVNKKEMAKYLLQQGMQKTEVAKLTGTSRPTLDRWLN